MPAPASASAPTPVPEHEHVAGIARAGDIALLRRLLQAAFTRG